jgi:hypothetical protein
MPEILKIISVFLVAMVKYFYSPFYAYMANLSFWESVITIIIGGITSFSFFYFISTFIVISTKYIQPGIVKFIPERMIERYYYRKEKRTQKRLQKKKFTKRNRFLIKIKLSGMWLIIVTTPVLLSLPVGAFLLNKYFKEKKSAFPLALMAIVVEGFIICLLVWNFSVDK